MDITYSPAPTSITGPSTAPGTGRGYIVQLGKLTGVQFNTVQANNLFTTPAVGGYTRCVVDQICVDNFSGVCSTASVSYGASGTPTDFAATATMAGATGTTSRVFVYPASGAAGVGYGVGVTFVANVTIQQGVATTGDISVWGWYE